MHEVIHAQCFLAVLIHAVLMAQGWEETPLSCLLFSLTGRKL